MTHPTYTPKLAAVICVLVSKGHNLQAISELPSMPNRVTLSKWLSRHPEFRRLYDVACARRTFVFRRSKTDPRAPRHPSRLYTPELAERICEQVLDGYSLNQISQRPGMPHISNMSWWLNRHDDFRRKYAWASHLRNMAIGDEVIVLADRCDDVPANCSPEAHLDWTRRMIGERKQRFGTLVPKKDWLA